MPWNAKPTKRKKSSRPVNCKLFVQGDDLTIKIDLSERHGVTKGTERRKKCRPGDHVLANHLIAQLFPPVHVPDGNGGYRSEVITLSCFVEEPYPKETTEELVDRMIALIGRKECPFTPQILLGAISEALKGYPKRLIDLHADVKEDLA